MIELYQQGRISKEETINAASNRNDILMAIDYHDSEQANNGDSRLESSIISAIGVDKDIIGLKR